MEDSIPNVQNSHSVDDLKIVWYGSLFFFDVRGDDFCTYIGNSLFLQESKAWRGLLIKIFEAIKIQRAQVERQKDRCVDFHQSGNTPALLKQQQKN